MRWDGKRILLTGLVSLLIIVTAGMMRLAVFPILKLALHLDFSQEYRKVESVEKIRFWDSRSGKVYGRNFWGLRPVGRREDDLPEEKPAFSPDERYLLFYEIAYGGGYTDDETCYYRVIDRENGAQYTIYSGHKEWYQVYWE